MSQRFLTFPEELFERVFKELLPHLRQAWHQRNRRPQPKSVQFARSQFERISLEMIYRGLYHFQVAHQKGLATDPVSYFAAPQNRDLGIVKPRRKPFVKLIVAPFPAATGTSKPFFFEPSSVTPLTTGFQP